MTPLRDMADVVRVAAAAARELELLTPIMVEVVDDLELWRSGEEKYPPIEDLRQMVRALHRLVVQVAGIEEDTTNHARAAGGSWTPSPGMPCEE